MPPVHMPAASPGPLSDDALPPSAAGRPAFFGGVRGDGACWSAGDGAADGRAIPSYLRDTYTWAYLRPASIRSLDRLPVVSAILWGNYHRLLRAALAEMRPGQRVYQPACVYGDFSLRLARALGPDGHLDVADVVPLQVENCRRKLAGAANAGVHLWDARDRRPGDYDAVCCFFLLHEMPAPCKRQTVDALLAAVAPGGKAVFVDYHRPHPAHPLKPVMSTVFNWLEPFAKELWGTEIASYSARSHDFAWSKQTFFGGLYQKVTAQRRPSTPSRRM